MDYPSLCWREKSEFEIWILARKRSRIPLGLGLSKQQCPALTLSIESCNKYKMNYMLVQMMINGRIQTDRNVLIVLGMDLLIFSCIQLYMRSLIM